MIRLFVEGDLPDRARGGRSQGVRGVLMEDGIFIT